MFDNNPFSGALAPFQDAAAAVGEWVQDRLADLANFLGLDDASTTAPIAPPFAPPFSGGQCPVAYNISFDYFVERDPIGLSLTLNGNVIGGFSGDGTFGALGSPIVTRPTESTWDIRIPCRSFGGVSYERSIASGGTSNVVDVRITRFEVSRTDGLPDNCGDLPNPNPPFPLSANAFSSGNGDDGTDGEIVYAGLPVLSAAALVAALKLLAEAIAAAADALEGVRKIGEALKGIIDLIDELLNGKKEKDKENPKNRRYSVGAWRAMTTIDGLIPTTAITLDGKIALPYKVQVVIKEFPNTSSRILGVLSPSLSIDSLPLFYLLLQEDDFGISAVKTIRTLNSSTSIPPFHRGVFWNFRLNPQMEGKYRLFYQTEPEEEELVPE